MRRRSISGARSPRPRALLALPVTDVKPAAIAAAVKVYSDKPDGATQLSLKELRPGFTVHGFRTSFCDWISDDTDFDGDLGELAIAHSIGSTTRRSYDRTDRLEKRRPLMQAWSDYITTSCEAPLPPQS